MNLTPFIENGTLLHISKPLNTPTSITANSKKAQKDTLFVAVPGTQQDGSAFIEEALSKGANTIVLQTIELDKLIRLQKNHPSVSFFKTANARKALSQLAASFYPLQPDNIVAVTGTNGKTSVVTFLRQLWAALGLPAASFGTLGLIIEGKPHPTSTGTSGINTPDPVTLHEILTNLKQDHVEHVAFEASSHGLHQHRLDGVKVKTAVFTNLSNDHLDYHSTIDEYFEEKARLFTEILQDNGTAVLNADDSNFTTLHALCQKCGLQTITYGKAGETIRLLSITPHDGTQDVQLSIEGKPYHLTLPLIGEFQVYNVMAALGAIMAYGGDQEKALQACAHLKGVPGRLEKVAPGVYIDFAHTPDALSLALNALRPHTKEKLWVVFGCGGDRDPFKRPVMGEIAGKLADHIIITDDNPRTEDPTKIRQEILAKCPEASECASRDQAIKRAVEEMGPNDVVLIAGKGHETYQLVGTQALPFNDGDEVRRYIK